MGKLFAWLDENRWTICKKQFLWHGIVLQGFIIFLMVYFSFGR